MNLKELVKLRKALHREPELGHHEVKTAEKIVDFLSNYKADKILQGIGGNGVIAVYEGKQPGKKVLFRCELDALPIQETNSFDHRSAIHGVSHKCGHDGHMAIICGLAQLLAQKDFSGTAYLLFQPAEELGEGAGKVLADPQFKALHINRAFALHNLPGYEMGQVILKNSIFAAASKAMTIELTGKPSHASHPKDGRNPIFTVSQIIQQFAELPLMHTSLEDAFKITPVGIQAGDKAFGTSAAKASIYATLRSYNTEVLEEMIALLEKRIEAISRMQELKVKIEYSESFAAVKNSSKAVELVKKAAGQLKMEHRYTETPFPWSEDFGVFSEQISLCLFGLGAGLSTPQLHNEDYDFPDELIEKGAHLFYKVMQLAGSDKINL